MQASISNRVFKVSTSTIWASSVLIGIMAAIPKFLTLHIKPLDLVLDAVIALLFSLFVWYLNLFLLPSYSKLTLTPMRFIRRNLLLSLLLGLPVMAALTMGYLLIAINFDFTTAVIMWEFRGLVISLTISLFLFLFYQAHTNKQVSIELEKTRADNLTAQFELLKQQVNPHFLFNSLNTLVSMINAGDQKAARFVMMLSAFYRSSLDRRQKDLVTLQDELSLLNAYDYLLEARFEEGFTMNINIEAPHLRSLIPPFTLQLLVENCVKHNVVSLEAPLTVKVYSDGDYIIVENNLQPKRTPEPSTGTGLGNITERYMTSLHAAITVVKDTHTFRVKLPVKYEGN